MFTVLTYYPFDVCRVCSGIPILVIKLIICVFSSGSLILSFVLLNLLLSSSTEIFYFGSCLGLKFSILFFFKSSI